MRRPSVIEPELKQESDFMWKLFEQTGSVGVFLVYKQTQKNIDTFEKAKKQILKIMEFDFRETEF